jgi:methylmalonyl-CoA epimerase
MSFLKKINHIGIAVKNLEASMHWYQDILNLLCEGIEVIQSEQVRVAFFRVGESRLELLEPLSEESPIATFIQKRGEGIHHIAFEVEDIKKRMEALETKGVRFLNNSPKKGAHGSLVSFIHPKSAGKVLVELCDSHSKEKGKMI